MDSWYTIMFSVDAEDVISSLAVATTILQFLSGVLVCKKYVSSGTTAESSALPFISATLSCGFWLLYGLVQGDNKIITVNVIGAILMLTYSLVFYKYTMKKWTVLKQMFVMMFFIFITFGYCYLETDHDTLVNRVGILCCSITLITIASPMSKLFYVIRVKSTECLPFPMILMSFFVSMLWFAYGVLITDAYIQLPNFIGALLSLLQLSLFILYPRKSQSPSKGTLLA